jgi:hypothetical protein
MRGSRWPICAAVIARVLAQLGAQRRVGATQRVERDAIGQRRAVFLR